MCPPMNVALPSFHDARINDEFQLTLIKCWDASRSERDRKRARIFLHPYSFWFVDRM